MDAASTQMTIGSAAESLHPKLTFRVGITGHLPRDLPEDWSGIAASVAEVFKEIDTVIRAVHARVSHEPVFADIYDPARPVVRLLSSLAEGADRIAAYAALVLEWKLWAVLPFTRAIYERDFLPADRGPTGAGAPSVIDDPSILTPAPGSKAEFDVLLERAGDAVIELDGSHETPFPSPWPPPALSYLAAGQFVFRHSDVLIAIWNGKPARGAGGTGDIIDRALQSGTPVLWIDSETPSRRRWLSASGDLVADPGAIDSAWRKRLAEIADNLLLPPDFGNGGRVPRLLRGRMLGWTGLANTPVAMHHPLRHFLAVAKRWDRAPISIFSRAFQIMQRLSAPRVRLPEMAPSVPIGGLYPSPDAAAQVMAARYRSAFTAIIFLGLVAVIAAIASLALKRHMPLVTWTEVTALLLIVVIFLANRLLHWHDRWIDYRLLAEFRRATVLAMGLGRTLARRVAFQLAERGASPAQAKRLWVAWFFDAHVRAAPPLRVTVDKPFLDGIKAGLQALSDEQIHYHEHNHRRSERIAHNLVVVGGLLFALSLAAVLGEMMLPIHPQEKGDPPGATHASWEWHWLSSLAAFLLPVLATGLPSVAAALFAFRAMGEFEVLAKVSGHMQLAHQILRSRLAAIQTDRPLASRELGDAAFDLVRLMLSDVEDWAILFDVKEIETA